MAYTTVVSGTAITATWGNQDVRDQVIVSFPSVSARDAAIGSPVTGMVEYLATNTSAEGLTTRNSAGQWRLPWNMPWGQVARQSFGTQTTAGASSANADTGSTVTFTAVANRIYKFTYSAARVNLPVSASINLTVTDGANAAQVNGPQITTGTTAGDRDINFVWWESPAAGSVTRKLRSASSTATAPVFQQGGWLTWLVVEDIGPSGNPA